MCVYGLVGIKHISISSNKPVIFFFLLQSVKSIYNQTKHFTFLIKIIMTSADRVSFCYIAVGEQYSSAVCVSVPLSRDSKHHTYQKHKSYKYLFLCVCVSSSLFCLCQSETVTFNLLIIERGSASTDFSFTELRYKIQRHKCE